MCGVVGEWYLPESRFLSNSFGDQGCKVFNLDVAIVVYGDSTLVWVKYADTSYIWKWFDSNQVVVEDINNLALHSAWVEAVGELSLGETNM